MNKQKWSITTARGSCRLRILEWKWKLDWFWGFWGFEIEFMRREVFKCQKILWHWCLMHSYPSCSLIRFHRSLQPHRCLLNCAVKRRTHVKISHLSYSTLTFIVAVEQLLNIELNLSVFWWSFVSWNFLCLHFTRRRMF